MTSELQSFGKLVEQYEDSFKTNSSKTLDDILCKDSKVRDVANKWFQGHQELVNKHPFFKSLQDRVGYWDSYSRSSGISGALAVANYYVGNTGTALALKRDGESEFVLALKEAKEKGTFSQVAKNIENNPDLLDFITAFKEIGLLNDKDISTLQTHLTNVSGQARQNIQNKIAKDPLLSALFTKRASSPATAPSVSSNRGDWVAAQVSSRVPGGNRADSGIEISRNSLYTMLKKVSENQIGLNRRNLSFDNNKLERELTEEFIKVADYIIGAKDREQARRRYDEVFMHSSSRGASMLEYWVDLKRNKSASAELANKYGDVQKKVGVDHVNQRLQDIENENAGSASLAEVVPDMNRMLQNVDNLLKSMSSIPENEDDLFNLPDVKKALSNLQGVERERFISKLRIKTNQAWLARQLEANPALYQQFENEERVLKVKFSTLPQPYLDYAKNNRQILNDLRNQFKRDEDFEMSLSDFKRKVGLEAFKLRLDKISNKGSKVYELEGLYDIIRQGR